MKKNHIYREFFYEMQRVCRSRAYPEDKEAALHDAVNRTEKLLEENETEEQPSEPAEEQPSEPAEE